MAKPGQARTLSGRRGFHDAIGHDGL